MYEREQKKTNDGVGQPWIAFIVQGLGFFSDLAAKMQFTRIMVCKEKT
jgi:hypothetical protein